MQEQVLERIKSDANEPFVSDLTISFSGVEIILLDQYIKRLEEKEQILNALINKK